MTLELARLRIVGLPHHSAGIVWEAVQNGRIDSLIGLTPDGMIPLALRPEPTNRNDPSAIEVIVPDAAHLGKGAIKLGYVRKQDTNEIGALIQGAGHLAMALHPHSLPEPAPSVLWRGLVETDAAHLAPNALRVIEGRPAPLWSPAGSTGKTAVRPRPKSRRKLTHAWF